MARARGNPEDQQVIRAMLHIQQAFREKFQWTHLLDLLE